MKETQNNLLLLDENNIEELLFLLGNDFYILPEINEKFNSLEGEGDNKQYFLHIFDFPGNEHIPPNKREYFFKIINSIKSTIPMDLTGIKVININGFEGIRWSDIDNKFKPKACVCWGINTDKLELYFRADNTLIHSDCEIIRISEISVFENDENQKKFFWKWVKKVFKF